MMTEKMTYSDAKEKFVGMTIVNATPEYYRHCSYEPGEDCRGFCGECSSCSECSLELRVDGVHATRRSFLLECDSVNTTVVVSKENATAFELHSAELSSELEEQVCNLGLELDEEKFLFCRTWLDKSHRYGWSKRIFVYPCEREKANCLIVATRVECGGMLLSYYDEERCGGQGRRLMSRSQSGDEGCVSLDFWRFRYDPKTDRVIVPAKDLDQGIDKLIEILE